MSVGNNEDPHKTEAELLAELDRTRSEFFERLAALDGLMLNVPSGLPAPDGEYQIRKSARQRDVAYANYKAAMKRFKDHLGDRDA